MPGHLPRPNTRLLIARLARLACLFTAICALVLAATSIEAASSRLLLGATGVVALASLFPRRPLPVHRLSNAPHHFSSRLIPAFEPTAAASDGRGWSYGEVQERVFAELRLQIRGVLALISLFVIGQVGVGILWMSASPLTLFAVEATLWGGIAIGLHLGWRGWRVLRQERWSYI